MSIAPKTLETWRRHLREEVDAAYLYHELAALDAEPKRAKAFERLAEVEKRHIAIWRDMLRANGSDASVPPPTARARLMVWLARRFGPGILLRELTKGEGREVKGYMALHRHSSGEGTKTTALKLARESAEHARVLQEIEGASGEESWHSMASGGFLRNVVYGFNDGLTANFGLVAGIVGANFTVAHIILSGAAGVIADSLSMGSSGYLAAKSEREVFEHEIATEREEIRLMPELEEEELALLYEAKGMEPEQARALAKGIMGDPERALEEMVREELKIGADYSSPMREAMVTGISTAIGAFIPVMPFFFFSTRTAAIISFIISMLAHFGVGAARSVFTGRGILRSGIDMFIVGLGVAFVAYVAGEGIEKILPGL